VTRKTCDENLPGPRNGDVSPEKILTSPKQAWRGETKSGKKTKSALMKLPKPGNEPGLGQEKKNKT